MDQPRDKDRINALSSSICNQGDQKYGAQSLKEAVGWGIGTFEGRLQWSTFFLSPVDYNGRLTVTAVPWSKIIASSNFRRKFC